MYLGLLNRDGEILVHRHMPARPEPFLKAVAPYREDLVVCVACLFPWDWLADLCAREGMPFVLGHALSRKAIHGGQANNDTIDAQKMAVVLRGGMRPHAYVYPADRRATRALLRRRIHLMRKRAAWLGHIQQTTSQDNLPDIGKKSADKAHRAGVAERGAAPAVHKSIEVDLALMGHDDPLLRDMELAMRKTAQQHDAHPLYLRRTVPGIGEILRLVLLYESHDMQRFPRGHDLVSSCRLVKCAKASAGKRSGTSGTKIGNASLKWACSEAAVWFLRNNAQGQKYLARLEKKHGQGKAWTVLAPKLARAVYHMFQRARALDMPHFLQGSSGAERLSPGSNGPIAG